MTATWIELGGDPAPGSPPQVRTLSNHLGEVSDTARRARVQLVALQRGELRACWSGAAADAFSSELDGLPTDLSKLEQSLDHASTALGHWASALEDFQDRARRELLDYQRADEDLDRARSIRDEERARLAQEALADPVAGLVGLVTSAERLAPYERNVDDAEWRLRQATADIEAIREDVRATENRIARLLEEASRLGIANKSIWQEIGDALTALGEELKKFLALLDDFLDLIGPALNYLLLLGSIINPAWAPFLAGLAVAFAALDAAVTLARFALGDEEVGFDELFEDGVDLAFALVSAKVAFAKSAPIGKGWVALDVVGDAKDVLDLSTQLTEVITGEDVDLIELVFDTGDTDSGATVTPPDGGGGSENPPPPDGGGGSENPPPPDGGGGSENPPPPDGGSENPTDGVTPSPGDGGEPGVRPPTGEGPPSPDTPVAPGGPAPAQEIPADQVPGIPDEAFGTDAPSAPEPAAAPGERPPAPGAGSNPGSRAADAAGPARTAGGLSGTEQAAAAAAIVGGVGLGAAAARRNKQRRGNKGIDNDTAEACGDG